METIDQLVPGRQMGRYRLVREIGRGAGGIVFLVDDTMLGESLCAKFLNPTLAADREAVERFNREILLARRIAHNGVCRLYDLHEVDGWRFITMEYVPGVALRDLIGSAQPPMPVLRAVRIAQKICEALVAAHAVGVVHRDLKPRNIIVKKNDDIAILDFGIARGVDMVSGLTRPGVVLGTVHYMAPEAFLGEPVTAASDQFSLGVMLFNCLTGKMPFRSTGQFVQVEDLKRPPPPPSTTRDDVPKALDRIVLRALAFLPRDRFASCAELGAALRAVADALGAPDGAPTIVTRPVTPVAPVEPRSVVTQPVVLDFDERTLPNAPLHSRTDPQDLPAIRNRSDGGASEISASWVVGGRAVDLPAIPAAIVAEPAPGTSAPAHRAAPSRAPLVFVGGATLAVAVIAGWLWRSAGSASAADAGPAQDAGAPVAALGDAGIGARAARMDDAGVARAVAAEDAGTELVAAAIDADAGIARTGPDATKRTYLKDKAALDADLARKGVIEGDDPELDALRTRAARFAKQRDFNEATDVVLAARRRVAALEIDAPFVKNKLVRFNTAFDGSTARSARAEDASALAAKELGRGRYDAANRALNAAFAALERR